MAIEDELRERLRKVEALFFGATTAREREAASAAAERGTITNSVREAMMMERRESSHGFEKELLDQLLGGPRIRNGVRLPRAGCSTI